MNSILFLLFFYLILIVNGVPTSLLKDLKDNAKAENKFKVKRSSNNENLLQSKFSDDENPMNNSNNNKKTFDLEIPISSMLSIEKPKSTINNLGLMSDEIDGNNNRRDGDKHLTLRDVENKEKSPHKRGINLSSGSDLYQTDGWNDEIDLPFNIYTDLQDIPEDYSKGQIIRNKPYDGYGNLYNIDSYQEPLALPVQYPYQYKYYNDERKKRSNKLKEYDLRLKRENTKLTPADMLALVALVEAGERAHYDNEDDIPYFVPLDRNEMLNSWQQQQDNSGDQSYWANVPYKNLESIPRYELLREPQSKYNPNRYQTKRFMVSKKKRSLGTTVPKMTTFSGSKTPSKILQRFL